MKKLKEKIEVMQAALNGVKIQYKDVDKVPKDEWKDVSEPCWDWGCYDYRVKPKPREWWIVILEDGHFLHKKPPVTPSDVEVVKVREVLDGEE